MTARSRSIARAVALALLAGEWREADMQQRCAESLNVPTPAVKGLVALARRLFPQGAPYGREEKLTRLLVRSKALSALLGRRPAVRIVRWWMPEPTMAAPLPALRHVSLPRLVTARDVCELVELPLDKLDWYADLSRMNRTARDPRLRHYRYQWIRKRSGAYRLLEIPKPTLKRAQRLLLERLLRHMPLHASCHGLRRGHSVATFVAPHAAKQVVVALDLAEFFSAVEEATVRAIFAAFGYSDAIARTLAGLCCTPTPQDVLAALPPLSFPTVDDLQARFFQRQTLRWPHLAQGAPSSPALANLAAYKLDVRLSALAASFDASYSRYADDLAFSGGERLSGAVDQLVSFVGRIVREEGFALRYRKTRVMRASARQQLCGVVVNQEPAPARRELERLEAILTNCIRYGPATQNRAGVSDFRAHLRGRVEWARHIHRQKGERLAALLARIDWSYAVGAP